MLLHNTHNKCKDMGKIYWETKIQEKFFFCWRKIAVSMADLARVSFHLVILNAQAAVLFKSLY